MDDLMQPVAWMWRCKPYCDWPNWSVSLKRPADSGRDGNKPTKGYEDVSLYTADQMREYARMAVDFEIDSIINLLMIQHEAAAGRHNYWQVAANLIQAERR